MILYFSGTGNSKHTAELLAEILNERLFNIENSNQLPIMEDDESLGIIFPVYAWGLPKIVENYFTKNRLTNKYVWTVMTCGDDMGYADVILEKFIKRTVNAAFSVQMPNTYVCLPGFDVDSPELAQKKVRDMESSIQSIAESIKNQKDCKELTRGDMPWMKTYVLRPVFNRFLVTDKYFKNTEGCNSCGLCAKQCPTNDIAIKEGKPVWQHQNCTGCLRCYHNCPKRAIEWGTFTKNKGQKGKLSQM